MKCPALALVLVLARPVAARPPTVWSDHPLSQAQRRELTMLVSDVVSVGFNYGYSFADGRISNAELVRFGIYVTALHHMSKFEDVPETIDLRLPARYVASAVDGYFGKTVRHQSVLKDRDRFDWTYKNGYYYGESDLFEQLGPEEVRRIRVYGAGGKALTVYADYVESMDDSLVRTRMTFRRLTTRGHRRYVVTGFRRLVRP